VDQSIREYELFDPSTGEWYTSGTAAVRFPSAARVVHLPYARVINNCTGDHSATHERKWRVEKITHVTAVLSFTVDAVLETGRFDLFATVSDQWYSHRHHDDGAQLSKPFSCRAPRRDVDTLVNGKRFAYYGVHSRGSMLRRTANTWRSFTDDGR